MKTYTDFIASKPSKHNWSNVFGYRPETEELAKIYGEMYAVMSITTEMEFDLSQIGGLLFDELYESYFKEGITKVSFNDFETAVYKVKQRIETILSRETELASKGVDFEMGVLIVKGEYLYGAIVGEPRLFIDRQGNFAEIAKSFIDSAADGFMRSGSLVLEPEDRILLSTNKLASQLERDGDVDGLLLDFSLRQYEPEEGAGLIIGYMLSEEPEVKVEPVVVDETPEMDENSEHEPDLLTQTVGDGLELGTEEDEEAPITAVSASVVPAVDRTEFLNRHRQNIADDEEGVEEDEDEIYDDEPSALAQKLDDVKGRVFNFGRTLGATLQSKVSEAKGRYQEFKSDRQTLTGDEDDYEVAQNSVSAVSTATAAGGSIVDKIMASVKLFITKAQPVVGEYADKLLSLFKNKPGSRGMYLRGNQPQYKWKTIIVVGAILLVVVVLVVRRRNEEIELARQVQAVETQISQLDSSWQQIKAEVVTLSIGNPPVDQKQQLLSQVDEINVEAKSLLSKKIQTSKLETLITDTDSAKDELLSIRKFTEPQLVTDLGVTFEGAQPADLAYAGGNIYIVDKAKGVIYRTGTSLKSEASSFASGFTNPYLITQNKDGDLVVVDDNADSILATVVASSAQIKRSPGLSKAKLGTLSAIDVYDNNLALYSINPGKTALFKQENVGGNYQIPNDTTPWRRDADFASGVDIAVDFSIFTIIKGKGMVRYIANEPATYNAAGFVSEDVDALRNIVGFEITPTKLYMADPANKRVIVADRTDENTFTFSEQFVYTGSDEKVFTEIKDIIVNEAAKHIFVLDGTRVIRLDM